MARLMRQRNDAGFIAVIAIVIIATGTLAFSLAALSAAASYADSVERRELRIQVQLNLDSCADTLNLMAAKDYFLNGNVSIPEFGCVATVTNDQNGHMSMNITATLGSISRSSTDRYPR